METSVKLIRKLLSIGLIKGFDLLKIILPFSLFFYKFIQWWYQSDFHKINQELIIPKPPNPIKESIIYIYIYISNNDYLFIYLLASS